MDEILDVAIAGGGVSGVYCAWRLLNDNPGTEARSKLKIAVFEGSNRIGGRLLSLVPPGMPHLVAELGGQNYFSSHRLVRSLVEKFHLPHELIPLSSTSLDPTGKSIVYLRGKHLRWKELNDSAKVPYSLDWSELGRSADALIAQALEQLIPGITRLTGKRLDERLKTVVVEGRPLFNWGFWNLIKRAMSQEAYEFARDSGGYDFQLLNFNAVDMTRMFQNPGPKVKLYKLTHGYERLPLTLADRVQDAGGKVYLRYRLKSFDTSTLPDGTQGVKMVLCANSEGWGPDGSGDPVTVYARNLILALPRRALELLDQTGALFNPADRVQGERVRRLLASVAPLPFFKIFLCYDTPWWEAVSVPLGKAVTDLPFRQCFYWGIEGERPGADKRNRNSLMMATFSDSLNVDYWAGLRDVRALPLFAPALNLLGEAHPGSPHWSEYRAQTTGAMVEDVQRQLQEAHDLRFVPYPYNAAFKDWGDDPYGAAAHLWNIHERSWELIPKIAQPLPHVPIYICGEAYARLQGYVEGALESAEAVLETYFHLPPPDWLIGEEASQADPLNSISEEKSMNDEQTAAPGGESGQESDRVPGVVLRGVDGTLYFIPDRALATFRVTTTLAKAAIQKIIASPDSGPVGGHGQGFEAIQVQLPRSALQDVDIKT